MKVLAAINAKNAIVKAASGMVVMIARQEPAPMVGRTSRRCRAQAVRTSWPSGRANRGEASEVYALAAPVKHRWE